MTWALVALTFALLFWSQRLNGLTQWQLLASVMEDKEPSSNNKSTTSWSGQRVNFTKFCSKFCIICLHQTMNTIHSFKRNSCTSVRFTNIRLKCVSDGKIRAQAGRHGETTKNLLKNKNKSSWGGNTFIYTNILWAVWPFSDTVFCLNLPTWATCWQHCKRKTPF